MGLRADNRRSLFMWAERIRRGETMLLRENPYEFLPPAIPPPRKPRKARRAKPRAR